jgi:hypothetical protein
LLKNDLKKIKKRTLHVNTSSIFVKILEFWNSTLMDNQKLMGMFASNALDYNNVRQHIELYDDREEKGFKV